MPRENDWPPATAILSFGAAVTGSLLALGYAAKMILPAVALAIRIVFDTAIAGAAIAGVGSVWIVQLAAGSVAVTGAIFTIRLIGSAAEAAQDKPYEWTLPLLGCVAGLMLNLWNDLPGSSPAVRYVIGGVAAFYVVIAGSCYRRRGWSWKCAAVLLYLLLPVALLAWDLRINAVYLEKSYFEPISLSAWMAIGGLGTVGVVIALLERVTR